MTCISDYCKAWWFCAALMWLLGANIVGAQDWPMRQPIRVIAPATAGSTVDVMARIVYEQVGRQLGQSIVVENRGGAGTTTGMSAVAHAAPDGYTIPVNSTSYVVVASTYAKLPYDPHDDMTGIALLAHIPFVVGSVPEIQDSGGSSRRRPKEALTRELRHAWPGKLRPPCHRTADACVQVRGYECALPRYGRGVDGGRRRPARLLLGCVSQCRGAFKERADQCAGRHDTEAIGALS
jgi:Tripartite tricarboxylate transporter family receptor